MLFGSRYVPIQEEVCLRPTFYLAIITCFGLGRDINLEILRVEGYRKFCNKIFNATKFAMLKLDAEFIPQATATVCFVFIFRLQVFSAVYSLPETKALLNDGYFTN